ncbi:uncharacterized protein [Paramisgurnus dabryanus]|uniref:uncharacterized protein n=1 Tax=Paramisgurnus dabryanus TaxID=90735 RepID=UPI003CCFD696
MVTISAALPCVLSLNNHLTRMLNSVRQLTGLVKVLQRSLKHRFKGIFVNVGMEESDEHSGQLPFSETIYMFSALLDPNFCLFWLDHDVLAAEDVKRKVKEKLLDMTMSEMENVSFPVGSSSGEDEQEEPPAKTAHLFMGYHKKKKQHVTSSAMTELNAYIKVASEEDETDCIKFWSRHMKDFQKLYHFAMRVLGVPATSAPVERVFSHGGLIMRPNRSRLTANTLSNLIFLKCNTVLE